MNLIVRGREVLKCHSSKDSRLSFGGPPGDSMWNDNRPRAQTNNRVLTTTADAEIFSSESLLKQFVEKDFMLGQYELYFNFTLESHIPSSTKFGWWKHERENTIKVRYTIAAEVVSKVFDIGNMIRTKKFIVNNLNPPVRKNTIPDFRKSIARSLNSDYGKMADPEFDTESSSFNLVKCGCLNKGAINLTVRTERSNYCYGDTLTAIVRVNNKLSSSTVEAVEFLWHKKLSLMASDQSIHKKILQEVPRDLKTWERIRLDVSGGTEAQCNFDLDLTDEMCQ